MARLCTGLLEMAQGLVLADQGCFPPDTGYDKGKAVTRQLPHPACFSSWTHLSPQSTHLGLEVFQACFPGDQCVPAAQWF